MTNELAVRRSTAELQAPGRLLTAPEFHQLAQVPQAAEWFANIDNPNTRRAYRNDLQEFMGFVGIATSEEFRQVTRAHIQTWRNDLERRELADSTLRRKLSALSSWFEYLAAASAITHNLVSGIQLPSARRHKPKTLPLEATQARQILSLPAGDDLKSHRDRAILSLLLFHGLGCQELSTLGVQAMNSDRGTPHLRITGRRGRRRNIRLHPTTCALLTVYLEASDHAHQESAALFRPIRNNRTGRLDGPLSCDGIYKLVKHYASRLDLKIGVQTLRVTAAAKALEEEPAIAQVQDWLGHANIATTYLYARTRRRKDDSSALQIQY